MRFFHTFLLALGPALATSLGAQVSPDSAVDDRASDAVTPDSDRFLVRIAIGATAQGETGRAALGPAFSVGVARGVGERLGLMADLTLERFDRNANIIYICLPDQDCPVPPGRATLIGGNVELVWGESSRPSAYIIGGGGLTRMLATGSVSGRTYPHVGAGIGWRFATGGAKPFLEVRWRRYVSSEAPMSSWTAPVLVGFSF